MKFPWRRGSPPEPEPVEEESGIDVTVPRECICRPFREHPGACPRCGGSLQQSYQSYLVITKRGREITDSFVMGGDMGWFCTQCPTVVINLDKLEEMFQYSLPHWDVGNEFTIAGIVDLDAVPEEKSELPLGDEDNPIPLVRFTRVSFEEVSGQSPHRAKTVLRRAAKPVRKSKNKSKKRSKKRKKAKRKKK